MSRSTWTTRLPRGLYSASQARELDQLAIREGGIAGIELMRRAASVVLHAILQRWPQSRHLLVIAGSGNNGGDGYLVAALASAEGFHVRVLEAGDSARLRGEALEARNLAREQQVDCTPLGIDEPLLNPGIARDTVLVDALLGIGRVGPLREDCRIMIEKMNASGLPIVSVDVPSGLDCDTGRVADVAVKAQMTVCFIGLKQGLLTADGPDYAGEIVFHDLGMANELASQAAALRPAVQRIDMNSVRPLLQPRRPAAHKGESGQVLVIGGDIGLGGAAIMAAEAAARSGAGTVCLLTRACHVSAALTRRPEIMVRAIEDPDGDDLDVLEKRILLASVIVIGPGLGQSAWSRAMLRLVLQKAGRQLPLVLDADALNLLAERKAELLALAAGAKGATALQRHSWVLTPHPGEAARLLGCSTADIQGDRFGAVRRLQETFGGSCLLKGSGSLLCHGADEAGSPSLELCTEGNPGMASGGMGDVLSGIIGAFIAQGLSLSDSLRCAVCVHGESADLAAASLGERGLLATDLLGYLPGLVNNTA